VSQPPDTLAMLHGLVATSSVSSVSPDIDEGNLDVVELLAGWLEDIGFSCAVLPLRGQPGKANLVATLGRGEGGLVLAGHADTVPYDAHRWRHDPLALSEYDNRLYGLGISDMKGFFALAIAAARRYRAADLQRPLILVATADEESSMNGARELAVGGRLQAARHVVIGEPTGLRPVRMHKGMMMEAVRLIGRAGHSSNPALGNNAMEGMQRVLAEILAWRGELQQRYSDSAFDVPAPTLNLGRIFGGDNPNRICGHCELHYDLRPLPGMDPVALREEIAGRLARVTEGSGLALELEPLMASVLPFAAAADSPLVAATEELTGSEAVAAAYATEAPFFAAGGMDVVVLGPGDIAQAHQPDEYLALDRLQPTIDLLDAMIRRFCV